MDQESWGRTDAMGGRRQLCGYRAREILGRLEWELVGDGKR